MKVLILGGDGYLGWPTAMHFANHGYEVYAIDNLSKRKIESEHGVEPLNIIKPFNERVKAWNLNQKTKIKHYISDLLNYKVFYEILEEFNPEIIHYAEQPSAYMASRKTVYSAQ